MNYLLFISISGCRKNIPSFSHQVSCSEAKPHSNVDVVLQIFDSNTLQQIFQLILGAHIRQKYLHHWFLRKLVFEKITVLMLMLFEERRYCRFVITV